MANLLNETIEELQKAGTTLDDVAAIQVNHRRISPDRFRKLADVDYDPGYGIQMVLPNLVIVLKDGTWLERDEYDGSEWWNHVAPPKVIEAIDDTVDTLFIDDFDYFNNKVLMEFGKEVK